MGEKLKIFVWPHFEPYTNGLAFAIAETAEEAQKMIEDEYGPFSTWGEAQELPIEKMAWAVCDGI